MQIDFHLIALVGRSRAPQVTITPQSVLRGGFQKIFPSGRASVGSIPHIHYGEDKSVEACASTAFSYMCPDLQQVLWRLRWSPTCPPAATGSFPPCPHASDRKEHRSLVLPVWGFSRVIDLKRISMSPRKRGAEEGLRFGFVEFGGTTSLWFKTLPNFGQVWLNKICPDLNIIRFAQLPEVEKSVRLGSCCIRGKANLLRHRQY